MTKTHTASRRFFNIMLSTQNVTARYDNVRGDDADHATALAVAAAEREFDQIGWLLEYAEEAER